MVRAGRRGRARTRSIHAACVGLVLFCGVANRVLADVASDQAAAILIFPKILVDTSTPPQTKRGPIDTLIRISNTSERPISLFCFYINANGHCKNAPTTICDPYDRSGPCGQTDVCEAGWHETDFLVTLSPRQPIAWLASVGAAPCDESSPPGVPCFPFAVSGQPPNKIQPVSEDPFVGELKCIATNFDGVPVDRNDLKGEAELVRSSTTPNPLLDVEVYNAIGIPAITGANDGDTKLVLGGGVCTGGSHDGSPCTSTSACPSGRCSAEYSGCPNILILDHFFDGAIDPVTGREVTTTLTLVPCSEDFEAQSSVPIVVQVLEFNEFEQRFSTSTSVTCFRDLRLTDIDASTPDRSLFSATVMGTLTGQTRFRGVVGKDPRYGYTLLGIAEEFRKGGGSAAFNLHFNGSRPDSDYMYLPH